MPLYDLFCGNCKELTEGRYFPHVLDVDAHWRTKEPCPRCNIPLVMLPATVTFRTFESYWTRNMAKDGSAVYVSSASREKELMKVHGVVRHPFNDSPEAKADPRELLQAVRESRAKYPKKVEKIHERVKALTEDEAGQAMSRADEKTRKISGMTSFLRG